MTATIEMHPTTLRALRDIATGHLVVWRTADGTDRPDRAVEERSVEVLTELGLISAPERPGAWVLTEAGQQMSGDYGWL